MESKEYLSRLRKLDNEIKAKCDKIEELKHRASGVSSAKLYTDRVQMTKGAGSMGDLIDQAVDLEKQVQELTLQYFLLKDRVINLIHTLDNALYIELLYLKYVGRYDNKTGRVRYMTLSEIAKSLERSDGNRYTYQYIRAVHGEALKVLDANMKHCPV